MTLEEHCFTFQHGPCYCIAYNVILYLLSTFIYNIWFLSNWLNKRCLMKNKDISTFTIENFRCKRNCLTKLSKNSLLILNANCGECDTSETDYEWSILVYNKSTSSFISINGISRINQTDLLETSKLSS